MIYAIAEPNPEITMNLLPTGETLLGRPPPYLKIVDIEWSKPKDSHVCEGDQIRAKIKYKNHGGTAPAFARFVDQNGKLLHGVSIYVESGKTYTITIFFDMQNYDILIIAELGFGSIITDSRRHKIHFAPPIETSLSLDLVLNLSDTRFLEWQGKLELKRPFRKRPGKQKIYLLKVINETENLLIGTVTTDEDGNYFGKFPNPSTVNDIYYAEFDATVWKEKCLKHSRSKKKSFEVISNRPANTSLSLFVEYNTKENAGLMKLWGQLLLTEQISLRNQKILLTKNQEILDWVITGKHGLFEYSFQTGHGDYIFHAYFKGNKGYAPFELLGSTALTSISTKEKQKFYSKKNDIVPYAVGAVLLLAIIVVASRLVSFKR